MDPGFCINARDLAATLPNQVEVGLLPHNEPHILYEILGKFAEIGVPVKALPVVGAEWKDFCRRMRYEDSYPGYGGGYFFEKSLEHFLAYVLLNPGAEDRLFEVVTEDSPFGDLIRRCTDAEVLISRFPPQAALHDMYNGGDLSRLPLPDASVSKAALISSLEHFERDTDMRLFEELARVIRPGGCVVVLPLYLYTEPAVVTDPLVESSSPVAFDRGSLIRCVEGWGHRHGRFYSPMTLKERLLRYNHWWRFTIYHVLGTEHIGPDIYLRFVLQAERI